MARRVERATRRGGGSTAVRGATRGSDRVAQSRAGGVQLQQQPVQRGECNTRYGNRQALASPRQTARLEGAQGGAVVLVGVVVSNTKLDAR